VSLRVQRLLLLRLLFTTARSRCHSSPALPPPTPPKKPRRVAPDLVHLARGEVVVARERDVQEALIVAKIQVHLLVAVA
jgi:hypothetical protein